MANESGLDSDLEMMKDDETNEEEENNPNYRRRGLIAEYQFNEKAPMKRMTYLVHMAIERIGTFVFGPPQPI